jgi:hypothetical protein
MKIVADISITSRSLHGGGAGAPVVITASAPPVLGPVRDGDSVQAELSPGALDPGNYASTEGAITDVSGTATINGDPGALGDVVRHDDVVSVLVTASDDAGNTRDFVAGSRTVAGIAPTLAASDTLTGRALTIAVDGTTGVPAPMTGLTALTLDGVGVASDVTGAGPWVYDVPSSVGDQTVAWTLTATNAEGSATASGSRGVAADLFAPDPQTAPQIGGMPVPGATVTIIEGSYSGAPPATVTGVLTLDGVDVTGDMAGLDYTIPADTVGQVLEWSETAGNGIAPDAQQSASVTVVADETLLLDTYPGAAGAWSLRELSSSTTDVVRVRRDSDNAEADFTSADVSDGTLESWVGAGNDGFVVTLFDQSGNGEDATQDTFANQPRIAISGSVVTENGEPALQVGPGDFFAIAGLRLEAAASLFAAFENVAQSDGGSIHRPVIAGLSENVYQDDGRGYGLGVSRSGSDGVRVAIPNINDRDGTNISIARPATGDLILASLLVDGGAASLRVNSGTPTSSTYTPRTSDFAVGYMLFGDGSGFSERRFQGRFSELIAYPSDQSTDRAAIEQDIADHYGITG